MAMFSKTKSPEELAEKERQRARKEAQMAERQAQREREAFQHAWRQVIIWDWQVTCRSRYGNESQFVKRAGYEVS